MQRRKSIHRRKAILKLNLIPENAHGENLRKILNKEDWDTVRKLVYKRANYVCEICGGRGRKHPVECHEEWRFSIKKRKQTLVALMALCPKCHEVKHFIRSRKLGKERSCINHLKKVNGWTIHRVNQHIATAVKRCSQECLVKEWTLDVSILADLFDVKDVSRLISKW